MMMMVVMTVSPMAMPVPIVSPGYDPGTPIHHWGRGHDYGRLRDDHRRRIHDCRRGSNDHWGGVHWDANANGDPDSRVHGQRQGGNRQAYQERTYPKPTVCVLHSVAS